MKNKKNNVVKVYHAAGWENYSKWIPNRKIVNSLKEADLFVLEGGTDVFAGRYGEPQGRHNESPDHKRDEREAAMFQEAVALGIPILGICRGSQFCCVMNHGRLVQHQSNPEYIHPVETSDGKKVFITSTHHQAQYPHDMKDGGYKLLAWTEGMSSKHLDGNDKEISEKPFKEAEIVYYPATRALGIQGHPESMNRNEYPETFEYLDNLLDKLLNNKF